MGDVVDSEVSRRLLLQAGLGLVALAGLPAVTGCASSAQKATPRGTAGTHKIAAQGGAPTLPDVVAGMREFGARLYEANASAADNWTVSPLSMVVAFGMLRGGCRGTSASELDTVFGFPRSPAPEGSPHAVLNALTHRMLTTEPVPTGPAPTPSGKVAPDPIVAIANGLFVDEKFASQVRHAFLQLLRSQYGATPTAVSFADPAAAATINAWVTRQTHGRIKKLFDRLDASTLLVLANAVYLKAAWLNQFDASLSTDGPFTTSAGRRVTARLMHNRLTRVPYAERGGWQRVSLPYVGGELTMRIVVPATRATHIGQLAPALAAATQPAPGDSPVDVELTLPRWDTATNIPLIPPLQKLGVVDLFDSRADLSGIASGLFVSDAIHRANITVDEQGTEAAAVTGIALGTSASVSEPAVMRVDRPFAWAVVHEPTGTPIFTGHVTDPTAGRR